MLQDHYNQFRWAKNAITDIEAAIKEKRTKNLLSGRKPRKTSPQKQAAPVTPPPQVTFELYGTPRVQLPEHLTRPEDTSAANPAKTDGNPGTDRPHLNKKFRPFTMRYIE